MLNNSHWFICCKFTKWEGMIIVDKTEKKIATLLHLADTDSDSQKYKNTGETPTLLNDKKMTAIANSQPTQMIERHNLELKECWVDNHLKLNTETECSGASIYI